MSKIVIYQVLPRLFGNTNSFNAQHGTLWSNGCGKLNAFTPSVLEAIGGLGVSHIWYTGIIEHASQTVHSALPDEVDSPGVVKGMAGSPYAIRDYYDICPDLAEDIPSRMAEFEALVARTHDAGLKVIIDFVPNHVARRYASDNKPDGINDFGVKDNRQEHFCVDNNYYYFPGACFAPNFDVQGYCEYPARVTGNDCFSPSPSVNDWYETVKLNYGVDYSDGCRSYFEHIPNTWHKMLDILLYWCGKGVDGFRCDMIELVPEAFFQWAIGNVKRRYPHLLFIGEVYNPHRYRGYLTAGFDYLYDKVGLYDTLRDVVCGYQPASSITGAWQGLGELQPRMVNFLENHDEQRIASDFFAGDPRRALPALTVSACLNTNPLLIYAGQELGERGMDHEGFSGVDGRTSIFDYWSVDTLRRWYNGGEIGETQLTDDEKKLQQHHRQIIHIATQEAAFTRGTFFDLTYCNFDNAHFDTNTHYAFIRACGEALFLVVVNFSGRASDLQITLPKHAFDYLQLSEREHVRMEELLTGAAVESSFCSWRRSGVSLSGYQSGIFRVLL